MNATLALKPVMAATAYDVYLFAVDLANNMQTQGVSCLYLLSALTVPWCLLAVAAVTVCLPALPVPCFSLACACNALACLDLRCSSCFLSALLRR